VQERRSTGQLADIWNVTCTVREQCRVTGGEESHNGRRLWSKDEDGYEETDR